MKTVIYFFGIILFLVACNNQSKKENDETDSKINSINQFNWLLGEWSNISNESQLYEKWTKENDSTFLGVSYMIVKNDTAFYEAIKLKSTDKDLFYIPTVMDQNDDLPVLFKLISNKNGDFVFENNLHDFPQRVIYNNSLPNVLNARIEGMEEGRFHKEEFILKRSTKNP